MTEHASPIRVKFMSKGHRHGHQIGFLRQLPCGQPRWGRCEFLLDPDARDYDWLVVYEDLAPTEEERFSTRVETLACPREHTLLLTMEPSTIKVYGYHFLEQFGVVLTSQEPWAVTNPRVEFCQPAVRWYYGMSEEFFRTLDDLRSTPLPEKTADLSTVCSMKQQGGNTLHARRIAFTQAVQHAVPEIDLFGRGIRPIVDKCQAIDPYRYHLVIENHIAPHYWTEKLADTFLGGALPFYVGCPNADEYFPAESFIPLDLLDIPGSVATIRRTLAENAYEQRRAAIVEARRRVLEEHNLFALIARQVTERHDDRRKRISGGKLFSRHAYRNHHPLSAIAYFWERYRTRRRARRQLQEQWLRAA